LNLATAQKRIDVLLFRVAIIAWLAFLIGTIVPGLIAAKYNVFYDSGMKSQIMKMNRDKTPAPDIESEKKRLKDELETVEQQTANTLGPSATIDEINRLNAERKALEDVRSHLDEREISSPFFLNDLMLAWSGLLASLAWLLFVVVPPARSKKNLLSWRVSIAVLCVYTFYEGPVWMRNFVLTNEERRVYSYANRDICAPCFWMQEIHTIIMFSLISLIWNRWLAMYDQRRTDLQRTVNNPLDFECVTRLSASFVHWQVTSVVLAMGFIAFTEVFWGLVIVNKDHRYLLPAVIFQLTWGVSWVLSSLPLYITWQDFNQKKMRLLLAKVDPESKDPIPDRNPENLKELSPISLWNGFGSAVTAALSFAFPIIHALLK
jgi:hypothetical protein